MMAEGPAVSEALKLNPIADGWELFDYWGI